MTSPTLNDLTKYLDHLDTNDGLVARFARDGYLTTDEARLLMKANQTQREFFLDEAFRLAHVTAHAAKCANVLTVRKVA